MLEIEYKNNKLKAICTQYDCAVRAHGMAMAEKIDMRIGEIRAAASVEELIKYKIGNCHPLLGNRKSQYAVSLAEPWRLVFEKVNRDLVSVNIIKIEDYH